MWKSIDDYDGKYEVSDDGMVRNAKTKHVLKPYLNYNGYLRVFPYFDGKCKTTFIHRLVAKAFVDNPDPERKIYVNHINENKQDNRADNLEWVTPSENIIYGNGHKNRVKSLSMPLVMILDSGMRVMFESAHDAEARTGIPAKAIQKCAKGTLKTTHGVRFEYSKVVGE